MTRACRLALGAIAVAVAVAVAVDFVGASLLAKER
jgi:hypothetical protein